MSALINVNL